jgi:hypothetical protein
MFQVFDATCTLKLILQVDIIPFKFAMFLKQSPYMQGIEQDKVEAAMDQRLARSSTGNLPCFGNFYVLGIVIAVKLHIRHVLSFTSCRLIFFLLPETCLHLCCSVH